MKKIFLTTLLVFSFLIFISCEDAINSEEKINKNDKTQSGDDSTSYLEFNDYDFGSIEILSSTNMQFEILNSHENDTIYLNKLEIINDEFGEFLINEPDDSFPIKIDPKKTITVEIHFIPKIEGDKKVFLHFNDSDEIKAQLIGNAEMGTLDFGKVGINSSSTRSYNLTNNSPNKMSVNSLNIDGFDEDDFQYNSNISLPTSISPGNSIDLDFEFTPSSLGNKVAYLNLNNNRVLKLIGEGDYPTLDFDTVDVGGVNVRTYTINNNSASEIVINSLELSDNEAYAFSFAGPIMLPIIIPSDASFSFQIEFRPNIVGNYSTYLFINGVIEVKCIGVGD